MPYFTFLVIVFFAYGSYIYIYISAEKYKINKFPHEKKNVY